VVAKTGLRLLRSPNDFFMEPSAQLDWPNGDIDEAELSKRTTT